MLCRSLPAFFVCTSLLPVGGPTLHTKNRITSGLKTYHRLRFLFTLLYLVRLARLPARLVGPPLRVFVVRSTVPCYRDETIAMHLIELFDVFGLVFGVTLGKN